MTPQLAKTIMLSRLKHVISTHMSGDVLRDTDAHAQLALASDAILLRFVATLAGEQVALYDESFPATWVDAVKQRWLPVWARKRWPVTMRHIKVDKTTHFPSIEIPQHQPRVFVTVAERSFLEDFE